MWVCVLWWLYGIWTGVALIFLSTLSLWVCVLCFMVFCDVGLVDRHCWWFDLVFFLVVGCLIQWILYGFYEHHHWRASQRSKEEMRDAEEIEKERKRENIILIREEREKFNKILLFFKLLATVHSHNSCVL